MAGRPNKTGLDYFPLDCHMDEKVELIEAEYGLKGFAIIVKLYQSIYSGFGYYCEWTPEISVLWAYRLGCSQGVAIGNVGNVGEERALPGFPKNLINEIVAASIRRNIFSKDLFEKYGILTSAGIQKRYLSATYERKQIEMKKEYLLISIPKNQNNVVINSINRAINSINRVDNEQSKGKESEEYITVSKDTVRQTEVRLVVDEWNSIGVNPVKRMTVTSTRYKMIAARIAEYGIDEVLEAVRKIKDSSFLRGGNKNNWMIDFEWFAKPNNFPKVLEGKYDDKDNHKGNVPVNDDKWQ